ncbi:MAG: hypothetical protein KAQ91_03820 [Methylococcales bacterium]|nr:hypothetical protein [Methylococcales bacterium]
MTEKKAEKKVKYIASMIYLLVFAFIVGGTYINQQFKMDKEAVVTEAN